MPAVIKCPECQKALKLNPALAGKRVRCPACKKPFLVPADEDELEEVDSTSAESEEEDEGYQAKRPARRSRRDADEDEEERPARRSRREPDDEEEEEEDKDERPRRKRRRPRGGRDYGGDITPSSAPLVYGILSILFCCTGIIGLILGGLAISKANAEIDRLPGGKRYRAAHKSMRTARVLGIIGVSLSVVAILIGTTLRIMDAMH